MRPMKNLTPSDRRELKARAHALKPVVMIGNDGLTPSVIAEINRALKSHELIKIRVAGDDRDARAAALLEICTQTGAEPVQHIGKILVIFKMNPPEEKPAIIAPRKPRQVRPPQRPDKDSAARRDTPIRKGLFDPRRSSGADTDKPAARRSYGSGAARPTGRSTGTGGARTGRSSTESTRAERAIDRTEVAPRARPRGRPTASPSSRHSTKRRSGR
jgi:putative YhbY family RNA-binding protein